MSNFPGQPHSAGPGRAMQLQTPHELTLRANSAPGPELMLGPQAVPVVRLPESSRPAPAKPHKHGGASTNTGNAAIIPDLDPWRRLRRRRRLGPGR
jgi:hypothetical protein